MRATDPTLDTPVPSTVDPSSVDPVTADLASSGSVPVSVISSRRSGRRAAVAGETAPQSIVAASIESPAAGLVIDASVSPRRAARAAREAAAAVSGAARASHGSTHAVVRNETYLPATAGETHRRAAQGDLVARRRRAALATRALPTVGAPSASSRRPSRVGSAFRRVAIVGVVAGILATTVLPVLEHTAGAAYAAGNTGVGYTSSGSQNVSVETDVATTLTGRDAYGATSVVDYEKQVIANREAASTSTYTGPSAADYVANPLFSHTPLDRSQVFDVALQYLGTPYVHGGADPSAFDCSGLIMFVYAQFGISLAHYVPTQNLEGTTIPQSEAVPGDIVVFDNGEHDGFYAGNNMILDAPKPGGVVSVRPIWNQAHHFVRFDS